MRKSCWQSPAGRCLALIATLLLGDAHALDCGTFNFPFCSDALSRPAQYAGGFAPPAPFGGFGGGDECQGKITHTPVVLVHGNGDSAIGWASPAPARAGRPPGRSVYAELKARGYSDCEVFGVTYLDPARQEQEFSHTASNFHQPEKYEIVWRFIEAVKAYTGSAKVDVVGHSFGASMTLAALDYYSDEKYGRNENAWASVRRFINIAGGLRGLNSCVWGIYLASTCQAEHSGRPDAFYQFGFYPDLPWWGGINRWTAVLGERSLRRAPLRHPGVDFYTIHVGRQDDIHCPLSLAAVPTPLNCSKGSLFETANNVRAQLNIGADPEKPLPPWIEYVDQDYKGLVPRDLGGVGHFGARNYAGPIIAQMLTSDCRGTACKGSYAGKSQLSKP
jgi:pimeloyl-ACP methyl ester carboxylesterase